MSAVLLSYMAAFHSQHLNGLFLTGSSGVLCAGVNVRRLEVDSALSWKGWLNSTLRLDSWVIPDKSG
jgi:hypothetical protein